MLEKAMAEFRAGNIEVARSQLNGMLEDHPQVPHLHLALARCALNDEQYDNAMEHVQTALSLNGELPAAFNLRGEVYAAQGEEDKAIADFLRAVELNPGLVKAHINLARHYLLQEQLDLALEHCEIALEYEPHKDAIRLLLTTIYEQSGNTVAAQEEAHATVRASPGNVAAYFKQGMISFKQQDHLQAGEAFEGLLRLKPDSMLGHFLLGVSALGLDKFQTAERAFDKALELAAANTDPSKARESSERIRQQLILTYLKQGKREKALVDAKQLASESQSKRVLKLLADIYYESELYDLAAQQYHAIALKASRLSEQRPEISAMLKFEGSDKETADAWRESFDRLKSGKDAAVALSPLDEVPL